jgi:hypothetical protein
MVIRRSANASTAFTPTQTFQRVESGKEVVGYVVRNGEGRYLQQPWSDVTFGEWETCERFSAEEKSAAVQCAKNMGAKVVRVVRRAS